MAVGTLQNRRTKAAPFEDDFNDGNYTGWSVGGYGGWSWTASGNVLETDTTPAHWRWATKNSAVPDGEFQFSYNNQDTSNNAYRVELVLRNDTSSGDFLRVIFYPNSAIIQQYDGAAYTTLDTENAADTAEDVWYDVRIVADGADIAVWWGERGAMLEKILETGSCTVLDSDNLYFQVAPSADAKFDNIRIIADGFTQTTTFAVNNANEMTSMTDVNGTTAFAYDGWGRMESKSRGSFAADYGFRYGHFLADYDTNFPDEGDVEFAIGGDQKKRSVVVGGNTEANFRWTIRRGTHSATPESVSVASIINEEDANGDLNSTHVRGLYARSASLDGPDASTADAYYHFSDQVNSVRRQYDASKDIVQSDDFSPTGDSLRSTHDLEAVFGGHEFESRIGGYFARHRFYMPALSRWEKRDPLGTVDGLNTYAYVRHNPVSYFDPSGLKICARAGESYDDCVYRHLGDSFDLVQTAATGTLGVAGAGGGAYIGAAGGFLGGGPGGAAGGAIIGAAVGFAGSLSFEIYKWRVNTGCRKPCEYPEGVDPCCFDQCVEALKEQGFMGWQAKIKCKIRCKGDKGGKYTPPY